MPADPLLTDRKVAQASSNAAPNAGALAAYVDGLGDLAARLLALEHKLDADAGLSGADYVATVGSSTRVVFRETRGSA